ncbi:hypothetical protein EDD18DRAFT_1100490 [Armillaria luteobubalina]|uniref:Uncharacterized protein n=1 Tax=Armillaria luteobubalina TaxID=153913 RepID=A0AA39QH72_9AGAR|nr:hypothetical protein EDD18DRAFT_1100490 [Armillaria luteobubalina]
METITCSTPRRDDDKLCQELLKIGELINNVTTFEDRILNAAGVGNDLAEVQQIWEGMQEVKHWLEDILCGTLEGVDILMKAYWDETLLFQLAMREYPITTLTIIFVVGHSIRIMSTGGGMGGMREALGACWVLRVARDGSLRTLGGGGEKVLWYITKKMAPASWCTPEQSAWFTSQLVKFHQACLENTVGEFLTAAVKKFMTCWPLPECTETIAGNSLEDITRWAAQNLYYQKRKEQIENQFNNNRGKACVVAATTASSKSLFTSPKKKVVYTLQPQCHLRAVQIYSQHYYTDHMQPAVKKALLNRFLSDLTLQTGWWFSVIAGGPDPADGGNICIGRHKRNFEDKYMHHSVDPKDTTSHRMNFEDGVIAPYGRFLKTLFCLILMPPLPPLPSLPLCQPPLTPVAATPCMASTPGPVSTLSSLYPSTPTPADVDTVNSSILLTSHLTELILSPSGSSKENGGDKLDPQLFWQDATFGQDYFAMGTTKHDRLAYNELLGRVVLNHEGKSFPLMDALLADSDVNLGTPPEPMFQLLLLPSLNREHIDEDEIDAGKLTPVRKRHHKAVEGHGAQLGEEESAGVDDDGGEDHKWRMSKHVQKPPASHSAIAAGWLPSAVQYLSDTNLGSEWLDLLKQVANEGLTGRYYLKTFVVDHMASKPLLQCPLPVVNYSRSLNKALWKGGQNGLGTMLIGLMWWGQGTLSAKERNLWKATVVDIHACIRTLLPLP